MTDYSNLKVEFLLNKIFRTKRHEDVEIYGESSPKSHLNFRLEMKGDKEHQWR